MYWFMDQRIPLIGFIFLAIWTAPLGEQQETGEGNDEFKPTRRGEACQGWIAYLAADK